MLTFLVSELCSLSHLFLVSSYMPIGLSANITILFNVFIVLLSCWSLFWKWFLIFQNLIFLAGSIRSFSKANSSLTFLGENLGLQVIHLFFFLFRLLSLQFNNLQSPSFDYLTPVFPLLETNNFSPIVLKCSSMNHLCYLLHHINESV